MNGLAILIFNGFIHIERINFLIAIERENEADEDLGKATPLYVSNLRNRLVGCGNCSKR